MNGSDRSSSKLHVCSRSLFHTLFRPPIVWLKCRTPWGSRSAHLPTAPHAMVSSFPSCRLGVIMQPGIRWYPSTFSAQYKHAPMVFFGQPVSPAAPLSHLSPDGLEPIFGDVEISPGLISSPKVEIEMSRCTEQQATASRPIQRWAGANPVLEHPVQHSCPAPRLNASAVVLHVSVLVAVVSANQSRVKSSAQAWRRS